MATKSMYGFVSGKFRVIHAGHMRLFRAASDLCENLTVGLDTTDLSTEEVLWRTSILEGIEYVDRVVQYQGDVTKVIRELRPQLVIKGQEFRNVENTEESALSEYGGRLVFSSGANFHSESDLISDSDTNFLKQMISLPRNYMDRNKIDTERLLNILGDYSKLKVCVIGDLIIDEYINCHPLGMSQEEPTIVVTPVDRKRFFGGAGIVAAHCVSLGAETTLISVTGEDEASDWGVEKAREYGINAEFLVDRTRPTTLKQRFRSGTHTLLKVSHLTQDYLDSENERRLIKSFEAVAGSLDVLIFSDFSYGVLSPNSVRRILEIAKSHRILVSADSQSSSQIGSLEKFAGVDLVSATEREARLELKDNAAGLVVVAEKLRENLSAQFLLLKLGADGVLISATDENGKVLSTDEITSLNRNALDTSGAGDSMLAASTLALATGTSIYEAALIGSVIAGIQVGRLGNVPISQNLVSTYLQL